MRDVLERAVPLLEDALLGLGETEYEPELVWSYQCDDCIEETSTPYDDVMVYPTERDALESQSNATGALPPFSMPLSVALSEAKAEGATGVSLYDGKERFLKRWPV